MTNDELNGLYQIGGVIAVVAGGGFASLRWVVAKIRSGPVVKTTHEETKIYTTDSLGLNQVAAGIEAVNYTATEILKLLRGELAKRDSEEEKEKLKREVREDLRREAEMTDRQHEPPRTRARKTEP